MPENTNSFFSQGKVAMFANVQPCYTFQGRQIVPIVCEYLTTVKVHSVEVEVESDDKDSPEFFETDKEDEYGEEAAVA